MARAKTVSSCSYMFDWDVIGFGNDDRCEAGVAVKRESFPDSQTKFFWVSPMTCIQG